MFFCLFKIKNSQGTNPAHFESFVGINKELESYINVLA